MTRFALPFAGLLLTTTAQATPIVEQLQDGWWETELQSGGGGLVVDTEQSQLVEVSVWVDYALQNLSYEKNTGIVWTIDGWATAHQADGWYEGGLPDGREGWGVDIHPLTVVDTQNTTHTLVFEYAVFYEVGGVTHWDNNGGADYTMMMIVD